MQQTLLAPCPKPVNASGMKITAAVSRSERPAPHLEGAELDAPRPDEIRVRIAACGICHTDLKAHAGYFGTPQPIVLGHEGAGVVEEVGVAVTHLKPGDRVVMSGASCGHCQACRDELPSYCREGIKRCFGGRRMDGSSALSQDGKALNGHFFAQSSFASHAIADARGAVPISNDVPFEIAAPLACGVITGYGSVRYAFALRPGQSIAVFGAGTVGLAAVMAAKIAGASRIIVIEPLPVRRALALELGADEAIDSEGDLTQSVLAIAPDGVDFTFNTTTAAAVFDAAIRSLAIRGTAGFVAQPPSGWAPPMTALAFGGRSLRGIVQGDALPRTAIPEMIGHWRSGRLPIDKLVRRYAFADIGQAFADAHSGAALKPVLMMDR